MEKIKGKNYTDSKMVMNTLSFFGRNQYRDWKILVRIFIASFFIAIIFGLVIFFNIGEEIDMFSSNSVVTNTKKIKKDVLNSILGRMEDRQKNFDDLKANKPVVGDPGI